MEELRKKLIQCCNESNLPLEAVFFVVKDVFRDVAESLKAYEDKEKEEQKE